MATCRQSHSSDCSRLSDGSSAHWLRASRASPITPPASCFLLQRNPIVCGCVGHTRAVSHLVLSVVVVRSLRAELVIISNPITGATSATLQAPSPRHRQAARKSRHCNLLSRRRRNMSNIRLLSARDSSRKLRHRMGPGCLGSTAETGRLKVQTNQGSPPVRVALHLALAFLEFTSATGLRITCIDTGIKKGLDLTDGRPCPFRGEFLTEAVRGLAPLPGFWAQASADKEPGRKETGVAGPGSSSSKALTPSCN
ncbi:hypothetical protein B0H67DRAFT_212269 [Lasiosphaeris hirsuta]|uniref:Uncharacterized protein n=1 Tax=Lasiosphaeris hirsuta TaxID=260670 RepID=A0AA40AS95_9PEZI|nr:hypothetical protein B0H67DRAFT_212269 [Lasiosphaeris hirsuta]